jgi:hypothetical protein
MADDWLPIEALTRNLPGETEENRVKPARRAGVAAEIRTVHFQKTRTWPLRQPARHCSVKFSYLSANATVSSELLKFWRRVCLRWQSARDVWGKQFPSTDFVRKFNVDIDSCNSFPLKFQLSLCHRGQFDVYVFASSYSQRLPDGVDCQRPRRLIR